MSKRLKIVNQSRLPDAQVKPLVKFALSEIDTSSLYIKLIDGKYGGYAGSIWFHNFSAAFRSEAKGFRYGIVIRVPSEDRMGLGRPRTYHMGSRGHWEPHPVDRQRKQWVNVQSGSPDNPGRWPVVIHHTWQEYIVGLTAHESKHVEFARERLPQSEIRCEHHQQWMLKRFREENPVPLQSEILCEECGEGQVVAELRLDYADEQRESVVALLCEPCVVKLAFP